MIPFSYATVVTNDLALNNWLTAYKKQKCFDQPYIYISNIPTYFLLNMIFNATNSKNIFTPNRSPVRVVLARVRWLLGIKTTKLKQSGTRRKRCSLRLAQTAGWLLLVIMARSFAIYAVFGHTEVKEVKFSKFNTWRNMLYLRANDGNRHIHTHHRSWARLSHTLAPS